MSGRSHKRSHTPGFESSQLHLIKPLVGAPSVKAASVGATLAPAPALPVGATVALAQETLAQKIARAIANANAKAIANANAKAIANAKAMSSLPRKVFTSIKSFKPPSKTSEYSIQNSRERNREQFIEDLKNKKILLNEAAYILTLYNRYPTIRLRIGDDTKINDIIEALQKRKADENTTEYDNLLEALERIRTKHSVWEGGKRRKTRRKRRRTTRSSK